MRSSKLNGKLVTHFLQCIYFYFLQSLAFSIISTNPKHLSENIRLQKFYLSNAIENCKCKV